MTDMDSILSIVENPTRRRILQALVREPHYPLQLSHELGISQQAIMKNLALMEKEGLLERYRESSNMGPDRTFYRPRSEFSIVIDMRGNMFEVRMTSNNPKTEQKALPAPKEDERKLDDIRTRIASIDRQLSEFEKQRQQLIRERNSLINGFLRNADVDGMDYEHRALLYEMLNRPNWGADDISKDIGWSQNMVSRMIDEIVATFRDMNDYAKED
ncbi:MAG: MarR family transcriptional regulator [Thermoplasmata archaeon]|jgi:predicted transcriptional regulator|nr:MarR family transcriptional regulator [Thermoplasmata archaeon]